MGTCICTEYFCVRKRRNGKNDTKIEVTNTPKSENDKSSLFGPILIYINETFLFL